MNCPNCQTSNREDAKFCMNCGHSLVRECSNCGVESPLAAKFCSNCGQAFEDGIQAVEQVKPRLQDLMPKDLQEKLTKAQTTGGLQGERRIVTILFCDVVGSTAAAENLDPEEWTEIMNGAFEHLITPVYNYEGTVARLMGDAIMALFGAPLAHEDDPQRAILAGLEITEKIRSYRKQIREEHGLDLDVRVGINTGLVVIGEVGSDLAGEYTAMGDAVNLAARMEQTAEPGMVHISEDTYRLVAPLFEVQDLGGVDVKGKSDPIRTYKVIRIKAEPGQIRGIEGLHSPLIGRENEIDALQEVVTELHQGRGQIVSVMGEAGLGKSRLVTELRENLLSDLILNSFGDLTEKELSESAMFWLEGRSLSFETTTPFAPFIDILTDYFQLQADASSLGAIEKITSALNQYSQSQATEIVPFLGTVLGLELSDEALEKVKYLEPPQLRAGIFNAIRVVIEQLASKNPTVLVFDDLHWIDPSSLDLLEQLLPLTDQFSLLIVGIFRPRRDTPSWRFHETASRDYDHRYRSISLQPLDEDRSRELVANLLEVEDLPEKVRSLIMAKAEGNPFFVEEIIRSLLDAELVVRENSHWRATRAIEEIAVPDTLAGVITSRLDRLNDQVKFVAQTAAVIGRQFEFETLAAVYQPTSELEDALKTLQHRELIREKSRIPKRVYFFKHTLTQETAHASLLKRKGQELHLRVGEYLEGTQPNNESEIARHFLDAGEAARALPYLVGAGDRANRGSAAAEAIDFYNRALEILDPRQEIDLVRRAYEGLGSAKSFSGDIPGAIGTYHTMIQLGQELDEEGMQVSALNKLGFVTGLMMEQYPQANSHLDQAEKLARESEDFAGLAELHMVRCGICTATGDLDGAISHLGESTQLGRELNAEEPLLFGLAHSASTLTFLARFDEAWEKAQEALKIAEELGNRRYIAELMDFTIPFHHLHHGDLALARETAEEGLRIAEEIGSVPSQGRASLTLGQIARMQGDYDQAIKYNEQVVKLAGVSGPANFRMLPLCNLGTVYLDISESLVERTEELHGKVMNLLKTPSGLAWGSSAWLELGICSLALGKIDEAEQYFKKGLTEPTTLMHLHRSQLLVGSAFVALARKDIDAAEKFVTKAQETVNSLGLRNDSPLVLLADAETSHLGGEVEKAIESFSIAEQQALEMNMRPLVFQARTGVAKVHASVGKTEEAKQKINSAREVMEEIAVLFTTEELREKYILSATEKLSLPNMDN
jgi:class 3 adenylate cyclase/tetratricopeptide (TPR) repeat protein